MIILKMFLLWLPAALIVCGLLYYRYLGERDLLQEEVERSSIIELEIIATNINDQLAAVMGDARLLASLDSAEQCLGSGGSSCRDLEHVFFKLSHTDRHYDHVRLITANGKELVRVGFRHGVESVDPSRLQDKSGRYYVVEGMTLAPDEVYVSPLDLNVENGRVEDPFIPMLRFVAPVFRDGERLGMVVLNFDASELLSDVLDSGTDDTSSVQMVNSRGYWLRHPNPEKEWGFMLPEREPQSLAIENPVLWTQMENSRAMTMAQGEELFITRLVTPDLPKVRTLNKWYLIKGMSQKEVQEVMSFSVRRLSLVGAGVLLILGIGCWLLVRSEERRTKALKTIRDQNQELVRQRERLEEERIFYRDLFQGNQAVFMLCDKRGKILEASRTASEFYGYEHDRLVTLRYTDLALISREEFDEGVALSSRPLGHTARRRHVMADGEIRDVNVFVGTVKRNEQDLLFLIVQDVTAMVAAQRELRENEEKLRAITESSNDAVIIMDPWGRVAYWNSAAETMFGYEAGEVMGKELHTVVVPEEQYEAAEKGRKRFVTEENGHISHPLKEFMAKRKGGDVFPVERSLASFRFKDQWWAVGTVRDITDRKEAERKLRELATTDALTGLFNRRYFYEKLGEELQRVRRYDLNMVLIMFDVDHFKRINDTKGHDAGDDVLRALSSLAGTAFRDVDVVGRIGGEEFCVMLPETDRGCGVQAAARFRELVEAMVVETASGEVRLTVSLGLAVADKAVEGVDWLMKQVDLALYTAKESGRNRVVVAGDKSASEGGAQS